MRMPLTITPISLGGAWPGHIGGIAIPKKKTLSRSINNVPENLLSEWSFKLYALCNLAWDYVDTLCDQCSIMKLGETKSLCRMVRSLRREYERFRAPFMTGDSNNFEIEHGLRFEEHVREDFKEFMDSIEGPVNSLDLKEEHRLLVIATYRCMVVLDAIKEYARWCDSRIRSYDVWTCDCCMVQQEVLALYPLIPQFAGDCWCPDLEGRGRTASILTQRLMEMPLIEMLDDDEIEVEEESSDSK